MPLNRTPHTFTSGETVSATELNTEVHDTIAGIESAWTSFVGGSALLNISVGDGVLSARYQRYGQTIFGSVSFDAGSTTAYGGGNIGITLPVPPLNLGTQVQEVGGGYIFNGGITRRFFRMQLGSPGASNVVLVLDSGGAASASSPMVMGPGTILRADFMYEAA